MYGPTTLPLPRCSDPVESPPNPTHGGKLEFKLDIFLESPVIARRVDDNERTMHLWSRQVLCRRILCTVPCFFVYVSGASAADIATVVGAPGSPTWAADCLPDGPVQMPAGSSQLAACAGPNPSCLHRVEIDAANFPNAVCSDGTPGTFYVRPGIGNDANRWVIHLQGGGTCTDYDTCHERWCGQQGALPYTANKMSSDWNGDGISDLHDHARAGGMAAMVPGNNFANWTHVFAYYCSSDGWQGQRSNVTYSSGANSFDLDARGHTILSAMRRMLRKNNANPNWTAEGNFAAPDLDNATDIIFSGTSAGGIGAINNADWFLTPFNVDKALVIDASMSVDDVALVSHDVWADVDNDGVGDVDYYSHRIDLFTDRWMPGGSLEKIDAFADESCRAVFEPIGRMDRCSQASSLLGGNDGVDPLIETETFVRVDLADSVIRRRFTQQPNMGGFSMIMGGPLGAAPTTDDFAMLMRRTLVELYVDADSVTGVFGPRCGQHVGLESNRQFGVVTTPDTDDLVTPPTPIVGTVSTFNTALWNWFNVGGAIQPTRHVDTDGVGLSFSGC